MPRPRLPALLFTMFAKRDLGCLRVSESDWLKRARGVLPAAQACVGHEAADAVGLPAGRHGDLCLGSSPCRATKARILRRARPFRRAGSRSLGWGRRAFGGPLWRDVARPFRLETGHASLGLDHRGGGREELLAGRIARAAALHVVVGDVAGARRCRAARPSPGKVANFSPADPPV